jgi:hypothetical protein
MCYAWPSSKCTIALKYSDLATKIKEWIFISLPLISKIVSVYEWYW